MLIKFSGNPYLKVSFKKKKIILGPRPTIFNVIIKNEKVIFAPYPNQGAAGKVVKGSFYMDTLL